MTESTWFPGKDFPDREKWLAIRATPRRVYVRPVQEEAPAWLRPHPLRYAIWRALYSLQ